MENITVNKQSSIRLAGSRILYFDPWDLPAGGDADAIFITHDHHDHYSPADVVKAAKDTTVFVLPSAMRERFQKDTRLPEARCIFTLPGESFSFDGISVQTVPSYNPAKPFHPKSAGWCGYVVTMDGTRCYITGDTDATPEAAAVRCDLLILPVGGKYTMDAEEAALLTARIAPKMAAATHYGPVVGTARDGERFRAAVQQAAPSVRVLLPLD